MIRNQRFSLDEIVSSSEVQGIFDKWTWEGTGVFVLSVALPFGLHAFRYFKEKHAINQVISNNSLAASALLLALIYADTECNGFPSKHTDNFRQCFTRLTEKIGETLQWVKGTAFPGVYPVLKARSHVRYLICDFPLLTDANKGTVMIALM